MGSPSGIRSVVGTRTGTTGKNGGSTGAIGLVGDGSSSFGPGSFLTTSLKRGFDKGAGSLKVHPLCY